MARRWTLSRWLALAGLTTLTAAFVGTATAADLPPDALTGTRVSVKGETDATALEVWTSREVSIDLGVLRPGTWRVTLTGRFHGRPNARYSFRAQVVDAMADDDAIKAGDATVGGRTFWTTAQPADGADHPLTVDVRVDKQFNARLLLTASDNAREEDAKAVTAAANAALAQGGDAVLDTVNTDAMDTRGTGVADGMTLEGTAAPVSALSYLLRGAALERLPGDLAVTRAWPDKLLYFPGDEVKLDVNVTGTGRGAAPTTGTVKVELLRNLDEHIELANESVSLKPGESWHRTLTWQADAEYGHALRVTATDAAGGVTSRTEYFSVSHNVFEVSLQGWGRIGPMNNRVRMEKLEAMPQAELERISAESALSNRRRYFNHVEFFSWAPDDFFDFAPTEDAWWSGTMTYIKVKRDMLAELRALQAQGIKVLSYAQPQAIGMPTILEMRKNPEFFAYSANGSPSTRYDYDLLKSRARLDMGLRATEIGGELNFGNLDTVDRGIDAMIASYKMFGWDGVRYDNRYYRANNVMTSTGEYFVAPGVKLDELSARNVKRQKTRFREEIGPHWLISHNNGYRFNTPDNTLGWSETVKDGLMCMDEETCNSDEPASNLNPWTAYMAFALEARRACTELGGYYQLFPPGRAATPMVDMTYYVIACLATGSHPITSEPEGSPAGRYGRFMTRWSALLWARDMQPITVPTTWLDIPQAKPKTLWWKEFANTRTVGDRRWLIYSLIIPPAMPKIASNPASWLPGTTTGFTATLPRTAYPGAAPRVYWLTGEGAAEPEPLPLPLSETADGWQVEIPRFALYGMLVIDTEATK